MRPRLRLDPRGPLIGLAALWLTAGCGDYSNRSLRDDLEFLRGLPPTHSLALRVADPQPRAESQEADGGPWFSRGQAMLGEPATYLQLAGEAARAMNRALLDPWLEVERVTRQASPTTREADLRTWGPWPSRARPELDARLSMAREGERIFEVRLEMRAAALRNQVDLDERWSVCLHGRLEAAPGSLRRGQGSLDLDLSSCARAWEGQERGQARMEFDTREDPDSPEGFLELRLAFEDFLPTEELARGAEGRPWQGAVRFLERGDRAGWFTLVTWHDLDGVTPPALEEIDLLVRWDARGAGQAQARASRGNLGERTLEALECWDEARRRVYYRDDVWLPEGEGEPGDCPSALPEP
jgi:hypothetical protein